MEVKARMIYFRRGEQGVVAELGSREEKREVMRRKVLADGVFADDDLTKREREVQQRLRRIAIGEREKKGEYMKIGFGKIFLGGKWRRREEEREELVELERGWKREESGTRREKKIEEGLPKRDKNQDGKRSEHGERIEAGEMVKREEESEKEG